MWSQDFKDRGYVHLQAAIAAEPLDDIRRQLDALPSDDAGTRNLLRQGFCRKLIPALREHLHGYGLLLPDAVAVQCTLFRKTHFRNWKVALHQDLGVPVAELVHHPALSGWSQKEGGLFVQPHTDMLDGMLVARLHVDACGVNDGPLRVVPGSHRMGRLSPQRAAELRRREGEVDCEAQPGDVLVMKPLLLHASSKARRPSGMRRVLHFLFGPADPGYGLRWSDAI